MTTQVQLPFDADSGAVSIAPEALVSQPKIDLLQALGLKGFDLLADIREGFRAAPVDPFDGGVDHLYQRLLAPLGVDGRVAEGVRPVAVTSARTITATWVLMIRRRSTMFRRFITSLRYALLAQQIGVAAPLATVVADEPSRLDLDHSPGLRLGG